MEKNSTAMEVVALALMDGKGHVLMHCRPEGKAHAGLWEFPGGKVESNENQRVALAREISEELGITVDPAVLTPVAVASTPLQHTGAAIVIRLYTASEWHGEPQALEGGQIGWFTRKQARQLAKPPLDVDLLEQFLDVSREWQAWVGSDRGQCC